MKCQSCGRQSDSAYCSECLNDTGKLKSYEDIVDSMTRYFVDTQGFDIDAAKSAAIGIISRQPAWERRFLTENRRTKNISRLLLAIVAIFFAVIGSGITWYLNWKNRGVFYFNPSVKVQNSFENVLVTKDHDLSFYELRCPADQKLASIDGSLLTFRSLRGSLYSPVYDYYVYDINEEEGSKVDPESTFFNTVMQSCPNGVTFLEQHRGSSRLWRYNPESKNNTMFPGIFIDKSSRFVLTSSGKSLDVIDAMTEKLIKQIKIDCNDIDAAVSDRFLVYFDRASLEIKIDRFDGKSFKFPVVGLPKTIHANNRYVFVKFWEGANRVIIVGYDAITGETIEFPDEYVSDFKISKGDDPENTVVVWSYKEQSSRDQEARSGLRYARMDNPTDVFTKYETQEQDETPTPLAVTSEYLLWDMRSGWRTNTRDKWLDGAVYDYGLRFLDLKDGREFVIEEHNCDKVVVDGWFAAWEVFRGGSNDELFNVKVANLEQTNSYWNEIAKPQTIADIFGNIETKTAGSIQINEIRAKFNQVLSSRTGNTNISKNDNLALVDSQGNNEGILFNPSLRLAATYDADSGELRKILGNKVFSWKVFGNTYDRFDGLKVLETHTFNPKNGMFENSYTPNEQKKDYDVYMKDGKCVIGLRTESGNLQEISRCESHFNGSFVTSDEKGKWLVFISVDKNQKTLNVYDFKTKEVKTIAKDSLLSFNNVFASGSKLFYHLSDDSFETIHDLSTNEKLKIPIDVSLTTFDWPNSNNPRIGYVDGEILYLAYAEDVLSNGMKAFKEIEIGKSGLHSVHGDWVILGKKDNGKPTTIWEPRDRKVTEISILNMKTGEKILLDKGANLKNLEIIGDYLYWVKNRGRINLEFDNICFVKLK